MKISLNWAKQYTKLDLSVEDLVDKIGTQLGEVEEVINLSAKYQGIIVAKVVSCVKHPNADKLSLCMIDDGGKAKKVKRDADGNVQVVCGANNVRQGILVAWLPPGVTVPSTFDVDPFVLEARELRGKVSNGMIASPKELAVSDDHDGILILDEGRPGDDFAELFKLNDYIVDIENKMFTHRPDCFGILGVARELAGITGQEFTSPNWYKKPLKHSTSNNDLPITFKNQLPKLVPRMMLQTVKGVKVKSSPTWLQVDLTRVGIKPINNIVDITNYYMHLTGQPLHAYDYDKVKDVSKTETPAIVVRHPKKDEELKLLNGKTIKPHQEAIMIATDQELIGVGGVMGGSDTEVDDQTTNIVLECANFDMYSIRKTSMTHGLFTEAVTRFNKGQSLLQNDRVLAKALQDIMDIAGGKLACKAIDDKNDFKKSTSIKLDAQFVNARLGLSLKSKEMAKLLTNVEFVVAVTGDKLSITPPFWRTDIEIHEDIVEEVGRLYGYDHLPLDLPKRSLKPAQQNELLEFKNKARNILAQAGANEVLTYSFVHGDTLKKAGQDVKLAFKLSNALSPNLQYYRQSLIPSLLEKVHPNIKSGYGKFALFEIGKGHNKLHANDDNGLPTEFEMLDLVFANNNKAAGSGYFEAKAFIDHLAKKLGLQLDYTMFTEAPEFPVAKPYDHKRSALIGVAGTNIVLGVVGEFSASVRRAFKLPNCMAGFSIGLNELLKAGQFNRYQTLSKFPSVEQDISLKVPSTVSYSSLYDVINNAVQAQKPEHSMATIMPVDIYQRKEDPKHKQVTLRLHIACRDRTQTANEVNSLLEDAAQKASERLKAKRL